MTRMWMGNPKTMCRSHLLGEYKEIHQLVGSLKRRYSVTGYINNNCIEIRSIQKRHDDLVTEMNNIGYNHKSPIMSQNDIDTLSSYLPEEHINYKVNVSSSDEDRYCRCINFRNRRI